MELAHALQYSYTSVAQEIVCDTDAIAGLIQASDDYASFLRYPLVRCLTRGGGQRCGGFS